MDKINEIIAIAGLFLTLTTFLFNIVWPSITSALNSDESISGAKARYRKRKEILETLILKSIPLFLGFFVLFYINLPTAVEIGQNSRVALWSFDVDSTLFVVIECSLFVLMLFNGYIGLKLYQKAKKFK